MADKPIDLEPVADADAPPGRRICSLIVETTGGNHVGTGWFWGTHTIVTAAHVVNVAGLIRIHVLPGRNGQGPGRFGHFVTDLAEASGIGDFAAVFVREPVGTGTGAFELRPDLDGPLQGQSAHVAGYWHGDSGARQFEGRGAIEVDTGSHIRYALFTEQGLSGAPVWIGDDDTRAVAIHTDPSTALKITAAVADRLNGWLVSEAARVSAGFMRFAAPVAAMRGAALRGADLPALAVVPTELPAAPRTFALVGPADVAISETLAGDIAGMVDRVNTSRTPVVVRVRTEDAWGRAAPVASTLTLEEQALITRLASRLSDIPVIAPQLRSAGADAGGANDPTAPAARRLEIAVGASGACGCATLLDGQGVVLGGHTWPSPVIEAPNVADTPIPAAPVRRATSTTARRPRGRRSGAK